MDKELDKDNKTFTLIHCWNKLKEEDKWKAKRLELAEQQNQASKKKQKVNKDSTPRDVEATNTEDVTEIAAPESEARKRPQGVKKAKEALRRGGGEACLEALDKLWAKEAFDMEREKKKEERFLASLELEKKRLTLEEKKAEADLIKKEKEIMSMDMSSLTSLQQQYYETMQQKIVARRLAN
ncbi:uncharacterized protein [Miscanthus floridulus]|uniref:uncharacterized protein n=1 Tax=Miscanthus floridulus TaxID=154761 RepID=UPI003457C1F3